MLTENGCMKLFVILSFAFVLFTISCSGESDDSSSDDRTSSDDSSPDYADDDDDDSTTVDDTSDDDSADDDTESTTTTTTTIESTTSTTTSTSPTTTTTVSSTTTTTTVFSTTTTTTTTCVDDTAVAFFVEPATAAVGENISFIAVPGHYGTGVQWDLGDGGSSTNWEFLHSYDAAGDYEVHATVAGSDGVPCSLDKEQTFQVHIEDAADDTTDDDVADDTADDDATPLDPDITFVGGGNVVPASVAVDGTGTTYFFLARSKLVTSYTSNDGVDWQYHILAEGLLPHAGAGTDGVVRLAYMGPEGAGSVVYSDNSSGSFAPQTLDTDGHEISRDRFDAAVGADGHTHVVYDDLTLDRLRYATDASGSWAIESIPIPLLSGNEFSLAVDGNGWVHLAVFINGRLTHITNRNGSWATSTVNPVTTGSYPNIAVDADGYVHITFFYDYLLYAGEIHYSSDQAGSWETSVLCQVSAGNEWGCYPDNDVEVDASANIHILYSYFYDWGSTFNHISAYLEHESFPIGSPGYAQTEDLIYYRGDIETNFVYTLSATADREVHAGYKVQGMPPFELYHKKMGSPEETVEELEYGSVSDACYARGGDGSNQFSYLGMNGFYHARDLDGDRIANVLGYPYYIQWGLGLHTSIGMGIYSHIDADESGVARVVYGHFESESDMGWENIDSQIRLDVIDGTNIETTALYDTDIFCDPYTYCEYSPVSALAVDDTHQVHVPFYVYAGGGLRFYDATHYGEVIDAVGGDKPAVALDAGGFAHIAYQEFRNDSLTYGTNLSGAWELKIVIDDIDGSDDSAISIAVDEDNHHHILYSDAVDPYNLLYASDATGDWVVELVTDGAISHRHGMAVETDGTLHIAFYDVSSHQIRYAYNDGSDWYHFIVAEGDGQAGIALDEDAGTVLVGYVNSGALWAAEFPIP